MKKIMAALLALLLLAGMAPGLAAEAPAGSQTIMTEGFEGTWPSAGWTVTDISNDGYQRYWGKDTAKPYAGTYSAWPAAAGTNNVPPATGRVYPDNLYARMVYGPFDLSDALSAKLTFWLWTEIEVDYDYLYLGSSADGSAFNQEGIWEGTLDWSVIEIDLTPHAGDPTVWVRWDFYSDNSVGMTGPFVDDITITKTTLDAPDVKIAKSGGNIELDWADVTSATGYEVWRGTNSPYFAPGADCAGTPGACEVVTSSAYTHTGGSGNASNNYTYVVRSVTGAVKSKLSNRVGEFDFTLVR